MNVIEHNNIIDATEFNYVVDKLRCFFKKKGFVEVTTQHKLSILAACEDPRTICTYKYNGELWPLPQTGQMWLEHEMLKNPSYPGYFCVSTSYRNEPTPIAGRHNIIFPMFEFEMKGGLEELIKMEKELLKYLGYSVPAELDYMKAVEKYKTFDITHDQEQLMYKEMGAAVLLEKFPAFTSPFWNMERFDEMYAKKVDVILSGMETIGSAERSCNKEEMRKTFQTISDGGYAKILYDTFTKERVEKELEEFLSYDFFQRSGGGIGITRLISSMKKEELIPEQLYTKFENETATLAENRFTSNNSLYSSSDSLQFTNELLHRGDINSRCVTNSASYPELCSGAYTQEKYIE